VNRKPLSEINRTFDAFAYSLAVMVVMFGAMYLFVWVMELLKIGHR
jgi:hypothetical protein